MKNNQKLPTITINGQTILPEAIEYEFGRLVRFYSQHMPEDQVRAQAASLRQRAVEQVIGAKLLFERAAELDLVVTDADIDEKVEELTEQVGSPDKLDGMLKKQGLDKQAFRAQIKAGLRVDKLVEKVTAGVADPKENDICKHFEAHKGEYKRAARVQAQHILVTPQNDSPQAKFDAIGKINQIRERVATGGDFGLEAAAHSDCPSGKSAAGSLGWFSSGMMVPEFDKAVFALKVGELSEVIESSFGFHVIFKNDEEEAVEADFDDARESVRDFLRHTAKGEAVAAYVSELREKAVIEIS